MLEAAFPGEPVADLVASLRVSPAWADLGFVAVDDGAVVGYLAFTRNLLDDPARLVDVLVLSPLAVHPRGRRRGTGGRLVRHGLEALASTRPEPLVFLEGPPSYYRRFGFRPAGALGFRKPSLRVPDAAFQVLALPAADPALSGTLVYAEPFWRHDCVGLRAPRG